MIVTPITENFAVAVDAGPDERVGDVKREQVIELLKASGVVLFRGFDASLAEFNQFAGQFGSSFMTYKGGGYIRRQVGDGEDETLLSVRYDFGREKQDTFGLPLHGEMYYVDHRPVILWFYCVVPAATEGETTVCDGAEVYKQLSGPSKELLQSKRLRYMRKYLDGEWQKVYQTENIDEAAEFCRWNGLKVEVDRDNSMVRTEYLHPAIINSRWGGHTVYINNILPVLWQESMGRETSIVRFEDDSKIPQSLVDEVLELQRRLMLEIKWAKGDLVVIDNTRSQHGRRAFSDTQREIYLRLVEDVDF